MTSEDTRVRRVAPIATPTDLKPKATRYLAGALNILLADMLALYLKTKAKSILAHVGGFERERVIARPERPENTADESAFLRREARANPSGLAR